MRCNMQRMRGLFKFLSILIFTVSTNSFAHHSGEHAVTLHTNNTWDECAMVIDPSLTQSEWNTFAKDVGSLLYFRPTGGAKPLGKGVFDVALELGLTAPLKDYNGSWNNTFSHPTADHWLTGANHRLELPVLVVRGGVTDSIDAGVVFAQNVEANYGWAGVDAKYPFYHNPDERLYVATRISAVALTGVADFDYYQGAVDLLVSKGLWLFTPYVGIAGIFSTANEETDKVDLNRVNSVTAEAVVGTQFNWKYLSVAAEADFARINIYMIKIGAMF